MSTVLNLPASIKNRKQTPTEKAAAQQIGSRCSQTGRVAHDLRNCMSVLLLTITSLKDNGDQSVILPSRAQALENVVHEMERLVEELVGLAERQPQK